MHESMNYLPLVEVRRGGYLESLHFGAAAICAPDGELVLAHGDAQTKVFLRSTAKPFQALPLLESGAADAYDLDVSEVAIACASHGGSERHLQVVRGLQAKAGLSEFQLQCGTHPPIDKKAAAALARQGEKPRTNHHNCSGKHSGMLLTAKHLGTPLETYLERDHPLQKQILSALCQVAGIDVVEADPGTDGCSAPNYSISLQAAATAYARLAESQGLETHRAQALARIYEAMNTHPVLISGEDQIDAELMKALGSRLVAKGGAEGILAMAIRKREDQGPLGVLIKIADGDPKRRAIPVVAKHLLRELGIASEREAELLSSLIDPIVRSHRGREVGELRSRLNLR